MTINAQNYASTPATAFAQVGGTANSARDGSGAIVTVFTAGAFGSRIDDITLVATVTTFAGMVRLFLHDGTTARLWREVMVTANVVGVTTPAWSAQLSNLALVLKPGWSLRASSERAELINVCVTRAGDF